MATLYELDQAHNFSSPNTHYDLNWAGCNEKWIRSDTKGVWCYILPDGTLYRWTSGNSPSTLKGEKIDVVGIEVYKNPALLINVPAPVVVSPPPAPAPAPAPTTTAPAPIPLAVINPPPLTDVHRAFLRGHIQRSLQLAFFGRTGHILTATIYNLKRLGYHAMAEKIVTLGLSLAYLNEKLIGVPIGEFTRDNLNALQNADNYLQHPANYFAASCHQPSAAQLSAERTYLGFIISPPTVFDAGPDGRFGTADDKTGSLYRLDFGFTKLLRWVFPAGTIFNAGHPPAAVETVYGESKGHGCFYGNLAIVQAELQHIGWVEDAANVQRVIDELRAMQPDINAIPGDKYLMDVSGNADIDAATKAATFRHVNGGMVRGRYVIVHRDNYLEYPASI